MSKRSSSSSSSGISINTINSMDDSVSKSNYQMKNIYMIYEPNNNNYVRKRHNNLDTKQLTLMENINLYRLYYLRKNNLCRLLFIGLCIPFFFLTSYKILIEYITHRTVVNIEFETPTVVNLPSITLCVRLFLNIKDNNNDNYFLDYNLNLHRHHHIDNETKKLIESMSLRDIVDNCRLYLNTIILINRTMPIYDCEQLAPIIVSFQFGHKCFTYFSDIYGQLSLMKKIIKSSLNFDLFPSVKITFTEKFNKKKNGTKYSFMMDRLYYNRYINSSSLFIMIHETKQLPTIFDGSLRFVIPNNTIDIFFNEKNEILKPYPFDTNCFYYKNDDDISDYNYLPLKQKSYLELILNYQKNDDDNYIINDKNNNNNYLNQYLNQFNSSGECFIYCLTKYLNQNQRNQNQHHFNCINYNSIVTKKLLENYFINNNNTNNLNQLLIPFCTKNNNQQPITNKFWIGLERCIKICRSHCIRRTFQMTKINNESTMNKTIITLYRSNEPTQFIRHVESTSLETFLGNIGGHLHVWLGISIVEIFNYLIRLIRLKQFTSIFCCIYLLFIKRNR